MVSGQMMVEAVETVENDLECESDDTGAVRVTENKNSDKLVGGVSTF